ncbi:MAG: gluconokinase [Symploca sp. SIO2D2]|nr:gluconokinase [Symploca sp. SIO2D2]
MVYVVMGVCGCGKSTVGRLLAERLSLPFFDGDDFHPKANLGKLSQGKQLDDEDREPWLRAIGQQVLNWNNAGGAVLACSALKKLYRTWLRETGGSDIRFIYLHGSRELLQDRLRDRTGHFMDPSLLDSQLETLEIPKTAVKVSIEYSPKEIVDQIEHKLWDSAKEQAS